MNTTTTPPYAGKTFTAKVLIDLHGNPLEPPQVAVTSPGLRHLDEAVKKVLYFSDHNMPPARRAHPADRVTDNRQQFHRRYYRIGEATNFTEAG